MTRRHSRRSQRPRPVSSMELGPILPRGWKDDIENWAPRPDEVTTYGSFQSADPPWDDHVRRPAWIEPLYTVTIPTLLELRGYGEVIPFSPFGDGVLLAMMGHFEHPDTAKGLLAWPQSNDLMKWGRDAPSIWVKVSLTITPTCSSHGGRLMVHDGREITAYSASTPGTATVLLSGDYPHAVEPLRDPRSQRAAVEFMYTTAERGDLDGIASDLFPYVARPASDLEGVE